MECRDDHAAMAETLLVLAGEGAWAAARAFGAEALREGDVARVKHWRLVARAVVQRNAERGLVDTDTSTAAAHAPAPGEAQGNAELELPFPAPDERLAPAPSARPAPSEDTLEIVNPPIPLRARRQGAWRPVMPARDPGTGSEAPADPVAAMIVSKAA
jgi:hypothetical protein